MTSPLAGKTQTSAMILRAAVFATLVASASAQGPPPPATGYCPDPKADNYDATGGVESAPARSSPCCGSSPTTTRGHTALGAVRRVTCAPQWPGHRPLGGAI